MFFFFRKQHVLTFLNMGFSSLSSHFGKKLQTSKKLCLHSGAIPHRRHGTTCGCRHLSSRLWTRSFLGERTKVGWQKHGTWLQILENYGAWNFTGTNTLPQHFIAFQLFWMSCIFYGSGLNPPITESCCWKIRKWSKVRISSSCRLKLYEIVSILLRGTDVDLCILGPPFWAHEVCTNQKNERLHGPTFQTIAFLFVWPTFPSKITQLCSLTVPFSTDFRSRNPMLEPQISRGYAESLALGFDLPGISSAVLAGHVVLMKVAEGFSSGCPSFFLGEGVQKARPSFALRFIGFKRMRWK